MKPYVEEISFLQQQAIKVGNDNLELIIVPEWGSNLISILDKVTNTELLRIPASKEDFWDTPVLFGMPILFPPNRIENGTFTFSGRTYQFDINEVAKHNHIHGFVHSRGWELTKSEVIGKSVSVVTEFDSCKHADVLRQFPHHFILRMHYILNENVIAINAEMINQSSEIIPIGLGFHTSFRFPEESSLFALSVEKRWKLNERLLPTGELEDIPYGNELNNGMCLEGMEFDDAFLPSVDADVNSARLSIKSSGVDITYQVDKNFKHWVVYNKDGNSGFLCPEPYTWMTNAPNLAVPASLSGLQGLEPSAHKTVKTSLTITHSKHF